MAAERKQRSFAGRARNWVKSTGAVIHAGQYEGRAERNQADQD